MLLVYLIKHVLAYRIAISAAQQLFLAKEELLNLKPPFLLTAGALQDGLIRECLYRLQF